MALTATIVPRLGGDHKNPLLVALVSVALLLSGCLTPSHSGNAAAETDLAKELAEADHTAPLPGSMWGDHPNIKLAIIVGTVVVVLGGALLVGVALARADLMNASSPRGLGP